MLPRSATGALLALAVLGLVGWIGALRPSPAHGQDVHGWVLLDAEPGWLSNAYLDPAFPSWDRGVEGAFLQGGATALLEVTGEASRLSFSGGARRTEFLGVEEADAAADAWQAWLLRAGGERRLGRGWTGALELAWADLRRETSRRTLLSRAELRWTASPTLRLRAGPGIAVRRLPVAEAEDGGIPGPGFPPLPLPGGAEPVDRAVATSYLLTAGVEGWGGARWRWEAEAFAAHTDAADLGLDYRGLGARARVRRRLARGARLEAGAGVESFGYRAAVETTGGGTDGTDGSASEPPADELLWRGDLALGVPLAARTELVARLSALRAEVETGSGVRAMDWRLSAGLRVTLGGRLGGRTAQRWWAPVEGGARLRIRHEGPGRLYLTGDFNGWADPGLPLERVAPGVHGAELRLAPGTYRYRVRAVEDGSERWVELPPGVPTADDGFGGENGVLVIEAAGTPRRSEGEDR